MPIAKALASKAESLRNRASGKKKEPKSAFGGFRKRTITASQLAGSAVSLVPELGMIYQVWLRKEFDPAFREELMLAVSRLNDCRYCSWAHQEWAHLSGSSDEELAQVEQLDPKGFDRKKWLAITYVRALVKRDFRGVQPELRRAMQHKYSPRDIRAIELIARVMDIGNRSSNTWDAMLSRLRGVPAADSRIVDEIILSGLFLTAAPVVVLYLSRASNRPFLEMARSMVDYTMKYEEKVPVGRRAK